MYVEIGDLPVWRGVQDKPGFEIMNFSLYLENDLVRLKIPDIKKKQIAKSYGDRDYTFITSPPGASEWGNRLGNFYFKILSTWIGSLSGKTVLEIGSGTLFIGNKIINDLNAKYFIACDPALIINNVNSKILIEKKFFSYDLLASNSGNIDLIISINNLEHILDFKQYLDDVHRLLKTETGLFFVVVPDCSRGFIQGDLGICVHEHLTYFTPATLNSTLTNAGFSIEKMSSWEDTIFVLAKPISNNLSQKNGIARSKQMIENFRDNIDSNLELIKTTLDQYKIRGPVALHGCCVGLNNILGLLDIHDDPAIYLFDGDLQKQGRYLPVYNRPILSSEDNRYREMKTVLIAALTYYEEIKTGLQITHNIPSNSIYPIIPGLNQEGK